MAKILSKSGIINGYGVEAWHVTQSVDAFTKVEAYDITVSGSFQTTGSLKVAGTISGRTSQSSSIAITSSYASSSTNTVSASISSYNSSNQYTLQFYSPMTSSLANDEFYGIGMGEELIPNGIYGVTIPIDSVIVGDVIVVSTCKNVGNMSSTLYLMSDASNIEYTFNEVIEYKNNYSFFSEHINTIPVSEGTRIWFKIITNASSTPEFLTHNIILTLQPQ